MDNLIGKRVEDADIGAGVIIAQSEKHVTILLDEPGDGNFAREMIVEISSLTPANDDAVEQLNRIMDMVSEPILVMTDEEIIADCIADGKDPQAIAAGVKKMLLDTVDRFKREKAS